MSGDEWSASEAPVVLSDDRCVLQPASRAWAAPKLKDVVDGGVTELVPSSIMESFSAAEKKVGSFILFASLQAPVLAISHNVQW